MRNLLLLIFLLGWLVLPPGHTIAQEATSILAINGVDFVLVPAGPFTMGSDTGSADERPVHTVTLPDYYIMRTEVTIAQYDQLVQATGRSRPNTSGRGPTHPVRWVDVSDATAYCTWLGQGGAFTTRLPTEAEWEKAARGTDGRVYPWGNLIDRSRANYGAEGECCSGDASDGYADTAPVGSFPSGASPYGALDLAGNVWEWTSSLHWPYPYVATDGRENSSASGDRVLRGGSFYNSASNVRSALRSFARPAWRNNGVGFRCVALESQ
ncbi:MAG: SUMF1/EgtB/PvdO family nonheme iron enzyme [Deinococcus sp.]|nr:SUMF1/EgtB/PvdO family nonheme iron enzyme [Deinococcus sp.]